MTPLLLMAAQPGQKLWEFKAGDWITGCPTIGRGGTVYVASWDGKVYALEGTSGELRWSSPVGLAVHSVTLGVDGTVYAHAVDGEPLRPTMALHALDQATGRRIWSLGTAGPWDLDDTDPAVGAEGNFYMGRGSRLVRSDGTSGRTVWVFQASSKVTTAPVIGASGTVYLGAGATLYALEAATAQQLWQLTTGAGELRSLALGDDGTVFVSSTSGQLLAVNGVTGQTLWGVGGLAPAVAVGPDGALYVGKSTTGLLALDGASGNKHWESPTSDGLLWRTPAIAADGTVYVGASSWLYALDGNTGTTLWRFRTGGEIWTSPAIGPDGTVYVGTDSGTLYALKGTSGLAQGAWPKDRGNTGNQGRVASAAPQIVWHTPGATGDVSGRPLVLEVTAEGLPPLSYEWFFNGERLQDVTGPRCELSPFNRGHAGVYRVRVRNTKGVAESADIPVAWGHGVTVEVVGSGSVSGLEESGIYPHGAVIELFAVPAEGRRFIGWSGEVSGQERTLRVVVEQDRRVTAHFTGGSLAGAVMAGTGKAGFADGPGAHARFGRIVALDCDGEGALCVADAGNARIRRVAPDGTVTTLAGTGAQVRHDGPVGTGAFGDLQMLGVTAQGICYVGDGTVLRRVERDGSITTVGDLTIPGDGRLFAPRGLVVSPVGSVWVWGAAQSGTNQCWMGYPGLKCVGGEREESRVFERVGAVWQTRVSLEYSHSWSPMGEGVSGERVRAFGKGRGNEVLLDITPEDMPRPPGVNRRIETVSASGRATFASDLPDLAQFAPKAMACVSTNEIVLHDQANFYSIGRGGLVELASSEPPDIGLAVDRHGILYSATPTQICRFVPSGTVRLRVTSDDRADLTRHIEILSQPGASIRVEASTDLQRWTEVTTLVSTGVDMVEVPLSSGSSFFRALLLPGRSELSATSSF